MQVCPSYEDVLEHVRQFRAYHRNEREYGNLDVGTVSNHLDMGCVTCTAAKERAHEELAAQELAAKASVA
jgi:hypothetical protein